MDNSLNNALEANCSHSEGAITNPLKIKEISRKIEVLGATQERGLFHVEKQIERDGIEMGVLENGLPYLSERGLAKMCGIHRAVLNRLASNWNEEKHKPRGQAIQTLLAPSGFHGDTLYIPCEVDGKPTNAYTEPVCLAVLEYYAFDSSEQKSNAQHAFRTLARKTFRTFVYEAVGYNPQNQFLENWKHYVDRVDLTRSSVPTGYFCIFSEIAPMIVPLIQGGLPVSDKIIPDISVGKIWSNYWNEQNLDEVCGNRIRYDHNYPEYYPQAKSNPQPAWAYPEVALGLFRQWLRTNYIETKLPKYLSDKAKSGLISNDKLPAVLNNLQTKKSLPEK